MPFVGADVGGFFGNPEPELLWRWYQLGAFQPFFRAHAHLDSKRREPWVFEEPWTGRMRNAIRYRYRLLPLWNELFYESHKTGIPAMRPIWYNYPKVSFEIVFVCYQFYQETESYGVEEEYMLGDTLLVAPVMDEGKRDLEVYFPGGDKFFRLDYHEAPAYSGNTVISAGEDEQIPGFIIFKKLKLQLLFFSFHQGWTSFCIEGKNQTIVNTYGKRPDHDQHCARRRKKSSRKTLFRRSNYTRL